MKHQQILQDYERDGVARVRKLFSREEIQTMRGELERYQNEVLPRVPEADRTFEADGRSIRNLWRMEQHDEYFAQLASQPNIQELVSRLLYGAAVLVAVETFNKPAKTGSGVPPHQDNAYFCQSPPDMLTVWIAIDAATVKNGAIYYAIGSQHKLLPHAPSGVAGNSMGLAEAYPPGEELCGTLEPGDALIHHCQTIHRSDPNTTEHPRCGLLMVFRGAHTQYDATLKDNYDKARQIVL